MTFTEKVEAIKERRRNWLLAKLADMMKRDATEEQINAIQLSIDQLDAFFSTIIESGQPEAEMVINMLAAQIELQESMEHKHVPKPRTHGVQLGIALRQDGMAETAFYIDWGVELCRECRCLYSPVYEKTEIRPE